MKNILKTSVAAGALFALAAPIGSAQAAEKTAFNNGNSKVNLTMGGQIVRSLIWADDSERSQLFHVDGRTVGTRVRYIVSGQLTESVSVGGLLEHDVGQSNNDFTFQSAAAGVGNETYSDQGSFGIRHHFVSFTHKSMGTITLGQANSASNGAMESSLGNAGNTTLGGATMLGSIRFTTGSTGAFSLTAKDQTSTFDGLDRDDVVRYDTPTFAGFSLAASHHDDGVWDVAARYSGKIAGLSVRGAGFYANEEGGAGTQSWGVSGAVSHSSGLSVRANYGGKRAENSGLKGKVWMVGGEYAAKLSSLGATAFYVEYYNAEDIATAGVDMDTLYVGVVQRLDSIGSEMSLVYGRHNLSDSASTDYNNIDAVMFQTMLNF